MSETKVATGNIAPSRFVKIDTAGPGKVAQCGNTERAYGISQEGSRRTPYGALDDGYCAIAGENLCVYTAGDKNVMLELGGTVDEGSYLGSDASGKGVAVTANLAEYCAQALAAGVSGELIPVRVTFPAQISVT